MWLVEQDVRCHVCTTRKHAPRDTFFRNHKLNHVSEMSLSYLQNMSIYYPSGKYKLSICSFLEYCYTIVFVSDILSRKMMFGAWYICAQNYFNPESDTNFYQAFHLQEHNLYPSAMKYFSSITLFLSNRLSVTLTMWLDGSLIDWMIIDWLTHKSYSFPNASICKSSVTSYFNFYFICVFNRKYSSAYSLLILL